jgi:hypothetical protein
LFLKNVGGLIAGMQLELSEQHAKHSALCCHNQTSFNCDGKKTVVHVA